MQRQRMTIFREYRNDTLMCEYFLLFTCIFSSIELGLCPSDFCFYFFQEMYLCKKNYKPNYSFERLILYLIKTIIIKNIQIK